MKKLKLEELAVETFTTNSPETRFAGTVRGCLEGEEVADTDGCLEEDERFRPIDSLGYATCHEASCALTCPRTCGFWC